MAFYVGNIRISDLLTRTLSSISYVDVVSDDDGFVILSDNPVDVEVVIDDTNGIIILSNKAFQNFNYSNDTISVTSNILQVSSDTSGTVILSKGQQESGIVVDDSNGNLIISSNAFRNLIYENDTLSLSSDSLSVKTDSDKVVVLD